MEPHGAGWPASPDLGYFSKEKSSRAGLEMDGAVCEADCGPLHPELARVLADDDQPHRPARRSWPCPHKGGDCASRPSCARSGAGTPAREDALRLPDQGRAARRLSGPNPRSAARKHRHLARPLTAHRHRPGREARDPRTEMWVIESLAACILSMD